MSVLIRDMEMPQYCGACCVGFCKQIGCDKHIGFDNYATSRHPDCPLRDVPPHGRLVDESWLKKAMITTLEALKKNPKMDGQEMHLIAAFDTLGKMVDDAPTIIEAEEENENHS